MEIEVVNRKTHTSYGKHAHYEYVGRPTILSNNFRIGIDGNRQQIIEKYRDWLLDAYKSDPDVQIEISKLLEIASLKKLVLMCWCKPNDCHADVIKELLEKLNDKADTST